MLTIHSSGIRIIEEKSQATPHSISLAQGTMRIEGIPHSIKEYVAELLTTTKTDYYQNKEIKEAFKHAVVEWMTTQHQVSLTTQHIMPSHGCMSALSAIALTLLEPGDEVLIPEPAYPLYEQVTRIARATPKFVSLAHHDAKQPWQLAIEHLDGAKTARTKMVIISNPSNPTGMLLEKETLRELVAWCTENQIFLVVDEVYADFILHGTFTSIAHFIDESPWVIGTTSLSKNFAMSGWRVGFGYMHPSLMPQIDAVQHALIVCPSTLGHWGGVYALHHPELIKPYQKAIHTNLALANEIFAPAIAIGTIAYAQPHGSFYLLIKTPSKNTRELCHRIIDEVGVALVPGETFGPSGGGYVRLCLARNTEVLREALERLARFWR